MKLLKSQTKHLLVVVLSLFFLLNQQVAFGQAYSISGKVLDEEYKEELIGANILLLKKSDSTQIQGVVSDIDGSYRIGNIPSGDFIVRVSYIGYVTQESAVSIQKFSIKGLDFSLKIDAKVLDETQVEAILPRMVVKGDTTEMNADAYKVNPDADAADLIKKMPGIVIQDGKVQAQGEDVKRVLVDNKEFFGDDAIMTLKNLPADVISKIQVYDKLSEESELSGFNDGETEKTINIVTRIEMRDGLFGRAYAGYATDNRYTAGGNLNYFKDSRRISLVGLSNNINVQNFSGEDLVGVASSSVSKSGGGMRMSRAGAPSRGGSVSDFLVAGRGGINTTHGIGLNYVEEWEKGIKLTGSYFYNRVENNNHALIARNYSTEDFYQLYNQTSQSQSVNNNHKLNAKLDYKIDDKKTLKISPSVTFQNNKSGSWMQALTSLLNGEALSKTENDNSNLSKGFNFNNSIVYNQRLAKPKRSLGVSLRTGFNNRLLDNYLTAENFYAENIDSLILQNQWTDGLTKSLNLRGRVNYTEPIGEKSQMQFNYTPSYTTSTSDRYTYQYNELTNDYTIADYGLSNVFENINWEHKLGAGYRYGDKDFNFNLGVDYQYSSLASDRIFPNEIHVGKTYHNILPSAQMKYTFSRKTSVNLFYRTNVRAPSVNQLQDVIDNTNPLILSSGNKDLDQQYSHSLGARWRFANPEKGNSAFIFVSGGANRNYITNATLLATVDTMISADVWLPKGGQYTRPVNVNGNWNFRTFANYGTPLLFMKSNLNLTAGFMFNKTPNFVNDKLHFNSTYNFNLASFIGSNISENVDFSIGYRANYNIVKYSQSSATNNYYTGNLNANITALPWKGLTLATDISYNHYHGLGADYNRNYALWNGAVGYKFSPQNAATISLQVFDILGVNNSISREVTETYVQDSQVDVLSRYFMLHFAYKFNKYNLGSKSSPVNY